MGPTTHVFIAGIGNSGPNHWQSRWHDRLTNAVWVEHTFWDSAPCETWVRELDDTLQAIDGSKVLVAHSLGCTLVAEWAAKHSGANITGAFLVAVPDVSGPAFPTEAVGFDPVRYGRLPFPSLVVASEDDPYGSLEHAKASAELFGASLVNVGRKGHINAESALGDWDQGWSLYNEQFAG